MRRYLVTLIILIMVSLPNPAFPWGVITHFRGGDDLTASLPNGMDFSVFIRANAGPDLAWIPLFNASDRTYIHTFEFAECLWQAANQNPQYPYGLATAYGWGVHLSFDEVAHTLFVPEDPILHIMTEIAVDSSIYHRGSPSGWEPLPRYHLGWDCCNPWLISEASALYQKTYDTGAKLIEPWMVMKALTTFNAEIKLEQKYITSKGEPENSERFLAALLAKGILPGVWEDYYEDSLVAAQKWIDGHPLTTSTVVITHTPIPGAFLLFGSGLLALAGFRRLRKF